MQALTTATSAGVTLTLGGLINLTVSIHGAVGEDDSSSLRVVCTNDHSATPVKQKYLCPACDNDGADIPFEKAREVGEGLVVIPPDVIAQDKAAAAEFKKQMRVTIHPASDVTGVLMPSGKSYYLSMKQPSQGALDTYSLLSALISTRTDLAFMVKLTLRSAVSLFQLTVAGPGTLVLRQMADAELVRKHPPIEFSDTDAKLLSLASQLADQTSEPFVLSTHGSGKSSVIAAYAESQTPMAAAASAVSQGGSVTDLFSSLAESVARNKAAKKAAAPRKTAAANRPAAKTTAAPVKKTAAKRTTRKAS